MCNLVQPDACFGHVKPWIRIGEGMVVVFGYLAGTIMVVTGRGLDGLIFDLGKVLQAVSGTSRSRNPLPLRSVRRTRGRAGASSLARPG